MVEMTIARSWEDRSQSHDAREVIVVGLGPIGLAVLRAALTDARFEVVGCLDVRADAVAAAADAGYEGPIHQSVEQLAGSADLAIVCTASTIAGIADLARTLLARGCHVVTSCEELIAPQLGPLEIVQDLHEAALSAGKAVVGAGVNPGFAMDVLPLIATAATLNVRCIEIDRQVNVARRRERLQEKVGVGIGLDEFARRRDTGDIGHVGLLGSLVFLANALGWFGETEETLEPVVAPDGNASLGVHHTALVRDASGEIRVRGTLKMYAGATDFDRVEIEADPSLRIEIPGGISGDVATVATLLNTAARIHTLPTGLSTPADYLCTGWSAS